MNSKATSCGSISTVFSSIVLLFFRSLMIIIIIIIIRRRTTTTTTTVIVKSHLVLPLHSLAELNNPEKYNH